MKSFPLAGLLFVMSITAFGCGDSTPHGSPDVSVSMRAAPGDKTGTVNVEITISNDGSAAAAYPCSPWVADVVLQSLNAPVLIDPRSLCVGPATMNVEVSPCRTSERTLPPGGHLTFEVALTGEGRMPNCQAVSWPAGTYRLVATFPYRSEFEKAGSTYRTMEGSIVIPWPPSATGR